MRTDQPLAEMQRDAAEIHTTHSTYGETSQKAFIELVGPVLADDELVPDFGGVILLVIRAVMFRLDETTRKADLHLADLLAQKGRIRDNLQAECRWL